MYLGIDCSTQSLKIVVINEKQELVKEVSVVYDEDLPHYKTTNGVIRHKNAFDNFLEHISTPTLLFIEALESCLDKIKNEGFDLSLIKAISASGQQHGSVWWRHNSSLLLNSLRTNTLDKKLVDFFAGAFSLDLSPIWMDASTTVECKEITDKIGSSQVLADITGSRAYERFTGPQIMHINKKQKEVYETTERISLISSFIPTLLAAEYAPIDFSDGSGMNILDIRKKTWDQALLDTVAPNLRTKLGEPVLAGKVGLIASYWCKKYGFSSQCEIHVSSGDNPCSLVGLGLNRAGDVGISLGTSDVLFGVTNEPKPSAEEGSILIHPQNENNYMMMLVYKNGATTRKHIRDSVHKDDKNWSKFNESIKKTKVGCNGRIGFYFIEKEITPNISNSGIIKFDENNKVISEISLNDEDCRSIIESQVMSYKYHAQKLGLKRISSILVTGGGSVNDEILQIIADVFEIDVMQSSIANTAASGAAIRAQSSYKQGSIEHNTLVSSKTIKPNSENFLIYRQLFSRFGKLESSAALVLNNK